MVGTAKQIPEWRVALARMEAMTQAYPRLAPMDRADLERWDREVVDGGTIGTHDWPGWERYIGPIVVPTARQLRKEKPKAYISPRIRWAVWERDNFTCQHCGTRRYLAVDHIVPEAKGGTMDLDNLQTLCDRCNSRKGARV